MDQNSSRHTATLLFALLLSGLIAGVARAQAPTAAETSTPATKKVVQQAQQRLQALGYQPGSTDGVMGARTVAALKKFQSDNGLPVTGQVDRKTLDALNARPAEVATTPKKEGAVVASFVEMPDDIACAVEGMQFESVVGNNGGLDNTDGSVTGVTCWITGKSPGPKKGIHLASTKITGGMLPTKQFGSLKITPVNSLTSNGLHLAIGRDKLKSLREYLTSIGDKQSGMVTSVAPAQASKASAPTATPAVSSTPAATQSSGLTVETPEPADKVVLKVGDQQFTKANIDFLVANLPPQTQQEIAAKGKRPLGEQYALIVMLSERARQQHLDQRPEFIQRAALQRQQLEAQEEINYVTPEELQQYYTAHAADFDQITVRQFVIRKKAAEPKADPAHPTASTSPGLAPEEAKARAEAIRKELAAGADIKKVMEDFKAPGDVIIEPEPRTVRPGAMRPDLAKVAFALKDGEVSEPVEIPQALVFFQVSAHSHLDLKDATPDIQKTLRQQKVVNALAEVKKSPAVWMDEEYFGAPPKPPEGPTLGSPVVKPPAKP